MDLSSHIFSKSHYTINIIWHVTYVYFNSVKTLIEFKLNEYTPLIDLKFIFENLLQYSYNRIFLKPEYRSLSIENEGSIQFNKFLIILRDFHQAYFHNSIKSFFCN